MPLITCPECGANVSDKASACPKCGAPIYTASQKPAEEPAPAQTVTPPAPVSEAVKQKVDIFLQIHSGELPAARIPYIRERMLHMDERKLDMVTMSSFKSPTTSLIISIFLGGWGIDRFLIGDIGIGIGKLITCGGMGLWTIIDWFLIQERTREVNFEKISSML